MVSYFLLVGSGAMAERLMALVLKTSDTERYRGFESLSLRQPTLEKYPSGRRGSPAKGVVRVTAARVQIPASPLTNPRNFNVPRALICLYCPTAAQRVQKACLKTIEKQGRQKIDSDDFFSLILKKRGFTLCRMKPLCAFYS